MGFEIGTRGICPHCHAEVKFAAAFLYSPPRLGLTPAAAFQLNVPAGSVMSFRASSCPACGGMILFLESELSQRDASTRVHDRLLWPLPGQEPVSGEHQRAG